MAIIAAQFDTKTKKLSITMDGQKLPDLESARFYSYGDDEGGVDLTVFKYDDTEKMSKELRIMASQTDNIKVNISQDEISQEVAHLLKPELFS